MSDECNKENFNQTNIPIPRKRKMNTQPLDPKQRKKQEDIMVIEEVFRDVKRVLRTNCIGTTTSNTIITIFEEFFSEHTNKEICYRESYSHPKHSLNTIDDSEAIETVHNDINKLWDKSIIFITDSSDSSIDSDYIDDKLDNMLTLLRDAKEIDEGTLHNMLDDIHDISCNEEKVYLLQNKSFFDAASCLMTMDCDEMILESIFAIIINVCNVEGTLTLIAHEKELVEAIENKIHSDMLLTTVYFVFLKILLLEIWNEPRSLWLKYIKKWTFFHENIIKILTESKLPCLLAQTMDFLNVLTLSWNYKHTHFLLERLISNFDRLISGMLFSLLEIFDSDLKDDRKIEFIKNLQEVLKRLYIYREHKCTEGGNILRQLNTFVTYMQKNIYVD